ncbi:MAG: DNA-binding protein WhiA [Clostridiales bacterium]|nr:DNA-binding protein WhiA [Clostridiales bacterium]
MSFAHDTKASLVTQSEALKHDCCRRAELYGILCMAGVFTRQKCKLVTTCVPLAELTIKWLDNLYNITGNLYITDKKSGDEDERRSCKITLPQKKELERLFTAFKYASDEPETSIKRELFRCPSCETAFIRGAFLSAGTLTDPDKSYHLEMSMSSNELADNFAALLTEAELEPKRMIRKNENVLYYKDSESIENFLAYIGANNAAFTIMNKKIEREIRSDANRIANSELANLGKTVAAAVDQISAINALISSGELERMPDELRQTAYLRLENDNATLSQLAALHDPPITKSGVNHRLKKIVEWKS